MYYQLPHMVFFIKKIKNKNITVPDIKIYILSDIDKNQFSSPMIN